MSLKLLYSVNLLVFAGNSTLLATYERRRDYYNHTSQELSQLQKHYLSLLQCNLGGKRGHKGGHRRFTDPQAIEQQRLKEEKEKEWRRQRGEESSEDEDEKESGSDSDSDGDDGGVAFSKKKEPESSSEEESSSEDEERKPKGAEGMIEIANPNRVQPKQKKVTAISHEDGKPQLSRREREEIEKQRAKAHYQKLHAQGKTEEARADLARLAIIKKQREEAAKKREEEKKGNRKFVKAK